jgi:hypothetical protein
MTIRRSAGVMTALVLGIALSACGTTTINHVLADPSRYADKEVTVGGRVVKSASVLGRGAYQIDDGSGTLWVVPKRGAPREGAKIKVTGRVRDVVNLGDLIPLPPEVRSGLVLIETSHKAD